MFFHWTSLIGLSLFIVIGFNNCGEGLQRSANLSINENAPVDSLSNPIGIFDPVSGEPHLQLSATGLREGSDLSQWNRNLISYTVNQPLWSDHALKSRFIYLPSGKRMEFSQDHWGLPEGAVLVKHFAMEISPGVIRDLETRVMVKGEGPSDWTPLSYRWSEDGLQAQLVLDQPGENTIELEIASGAIGGSRVQRYEIPNRQACNQCHNSGNGFTRGVQTPQLNREENGINQIAQLRDQGVFSNPFDIPGDLENLPRFYAIDGNEGSEFDKLRSYLSVHCASCHFPGSSDFCEVADNDFRYQSLTLPGLLASGPANGIIAGEPSQSPLWLAVNRDLGGRMPQFGSNIQDDQFVDFLGDFITALDQGSATEPPSSQPPNPPPTPPPVEESGFADIPINVLFAEVAGFNSGVYKKKNATESCRVVQPLQGVTIDVATFRILTMSDYLGEPCQN